MTLIKTLAATAALVLSLNVFAATPVANANGVVEIYLDQYGGHFTAKDTLASLKPVNTNLSYLTKRTNWLAFSCKTSKRMTKWTCSQLSLAKPKKVMLLQSLKTVFGSVAQSIRHLGTIWIL